MPLVRPTLEEIEARLLARMAQELGTGPIRAQSTLGAFARAIAAQAHSAHGSLEFLAAQVVPDTQEGEFLEAWASMWGIGRKVANLSSGEVTLTGTDGLLVPAGTQLSRADGLLYATTAAATVAAGVAVVNVEALASGLASDAEAGTVLSLSTPLAGLNGSALVTGAGIVGGSELETDSDLRARLRARVQFPPKGGVANDYRNWALEVAEVTRAFPLPNHLGAGTVGVAFVVDNDPSGPIPSPAKVAEVQAYIDDPTRRPVTAAVTVFAPVPVALDPTISLAPDDGDIRAAVEASLEELLLGEAVPGGTLLLSHVREAISNAAGEVDSTVIDLVGLAPANVTVAAGELLVLGTILWS